MNRYFTPAQYTPAEYVKPLPIDQLTKLGHEQQRQYENTVAKLEDQFTKITKFRSPSDIDTKNYHNEILSRVMPIAEEAARNPEFLRTPEGRGAMADVLRNTNYSLLGNLETNRDQMLERLEQARKLDERGQYSEFFHGPKIDFQNYDTANQGILNRTTLTPYKSIDEILHPFLKEVQAVEFDELLSDHSDVFGNTMKAGRIDDPLQVYYGVSNEQIQAATSRIAPTFLQTNAGQEHLAAWSYHIKKQNPGLSDQEVAQLAKERVITEIQQAGQKFVRVEKKVSDLGQWSLKASKSRSEGKYEDWAGDSLTWMQRSSLVAEKLARNFLSNTFHQKDIKFNGELNFFENTKPSAADPAQKAAQQDVIDDYKEAVRTNTLRPDMIESLYKRAVATGLGGLTAGVARQATQLMYDQVFMEGGLNMEMEIASDPAKYISEVSVPIDTDVAEAYLGGGSPNASVRFVADKGTAKKPGYGNLGQNTYWTFSNLHKQGTLTNSNFQTVDNVMFAYLTDPKALIGEKDKSPVNRYATFQAQSSAGVTNYPVGNIGNRAKDVASSLESISNEHDVSKGFGLDIPENLKGEARSNYIAKEGTKKVNELFDYIKNRMPARALISSNGSFVKLDNGKTVLKNGVYQQQYGYALPSKVMIEEEEMDAILDSFLKENPEIQYSKNNLISLISGDRGDSKDKKYFQVAEKITGGIQKPTDSSGNVDKDKDNFRTEKTYYAFNILIPADHAFASVTQASYAKDFQNYGTKEIGEHLQGTQYYSAEQAAQMMNALNAINQSNSIYNQR